MHGDSANERVLQAKYLDWCSARLAEHFLKLTPEEIFELGQPPEWRAEEDGIGPGEAGGARPFLAERSPLGISTGSYREVVARVTEVLASRLLLPSYEEWAASYVETPERYERELVGLWKRKAESG